MKWFEVTLKKTDDLGEKKTERYLIDAINFAEAETRAISYLCEDKLDMLSEDSECVVLKRVSIAEVHADASKEYWYRMKVNFITMDEKSGKEKAKASTFMVEANSVSDAVIRLVEKMKGTMSDWELVKVEKTDILEVIMYQPKDIE